MADIEYVEDSTTAEGAIIWFNDRRGYGFIRADDHEEDVYVHTTRVLTKGSLRQGDRVRFKISRDEERDSISAIDVERTARASRNKEARERATLKATGFEETAAAAPEHVVSHAKSARRKTSRLRNVQVLHLSVFTHAVFHGHNIIAVIVPLGMDIHAVWVKEMATSMSRSQEVVFVQQVPEVDTEETHENEEATAEAEGSTDSTSSQSQKSREKHEFRIRTFLNGCEVAASTQACIGAARALWDRRLSGSHRAAQEIKLVDNVGKRWGISRVQMTEAQIAAVGPGTARFLRHWLRVDVGIRGTVEPVSTDRYADLMNAFGADLVLSVSKIGSTAILEVADEATLKTMRVTKDSLRDFSTEFPVDTIAFTSRAELPEHHEPASDNEFCFSSRVFSETPERGDSSGEKWFWETSNSAPMVKADLGVFWSSRSGSGDVFGEDSSGRQQWRVHVDAQESETGPRVSVSGSSLIVCRGTLTPIVYVQNKEITHRPAAASAATAEVIETATEPHTSEEPAI